MLRPKSIAAAVVSRINIHRGARHRDILPVCSQSRRHFAAGSRLGTAISITDSDKTTLINGKYSRATCPFTAAFTAGRWFSADDSIGPGIPDDSATPNLREQVRGAAKKWAFELT